MSQITGFNKSASVTGNLIQQVRSSIATVVTCGGIIPFDDTIPQQAEGTEVLTVSITPKRATNILRIEFSGWGGQSAVSPVTIALFQDAGNDALRAYCVHDGANAEHEYETILDHYMTAGTVNATTFKIRIGVVDVGREISINASGDTNRKYGGVSAAQLIVTEFAT